MQTVVCSACKAPASRGGALAQGGQRRGETRGFDDVGGRAVHVLFAEQAGGVGQPAYGPIALAAAPEVLIPRGRGHARAVTARLLRLA